MASSIPFILFALFQMKFAIIAPAIITGSFAERVRFIAYLLFIVLFVIFIYTPLCHWVWHPKGILGAYFGVKDFAGGTVVHMSAGFAALAGAMVLGKRKNSAHVPTNIPFTANGSSNTETTSATTGNVIEHTIKPKENLNMLAEKYGTTINEIKALNQLKGNNLSLIFFI